MRRILVLRPAWLLSFVLLVFSRGAIAQYEYVGFFDLGEGFQGFSGGCHGLAVDPDGNVWMQYYSATDTIYDGAGMLRLTRAIRVHRPDGTPLPFSPIRYIEADGVVDTLFTLTGRGLGTDRDGNILASYGSRLYKIDYRTGLGMKRFSGGLTLTAATGDSLGRTYVGAVNTNSGPLQILDGATLTPLGNVVNFTTGYSRGSAVSPDGKTVYWAGYDNHCVYVYRSATGAPGTYALADTILKGFDAESFGRHPRSGQIWASTGSGNDRPNRFPGLVTNYVSHAWYGYDPGSGLIIDSIRWPYVWDSVNTRPRAIAFSVTGDTAYAGVFGSAMTGASVVWFINRNPIRPTAGQYDPDTATVMLLHLNEAGGSVAEDSSGLGNHALLARTTVVPGRFGLGRRFGAGGYGGRVAHATALNPSPALTLEAWFKPASLVGQGTIIAKPGPDGQSGYLLQIAGSGSVVAFGINTKLSATLYAPVVAESLMNGRWHHVAGVYDGSEARIYLDGARLASGIFGVTPGTSSTDSVVVGQGFDGVLDEVRISGVARQPGDLGFVQPPSGLKAMVLGSSTSLRWDPPAGRVGAEGYHVSYKTSYSSWTSPIAVPRPWITLRCLLPGSFSVRVASVDEMGNVSGFSPEIAVSSQAYTPTYNLASDIMLADVYAAADSPWVARTRSFYPSPTGWTEGTGEGWVRHPPFLNWCSSDLDPIDVRLAGHAGEARATVLSYRLDTPKNIALSFGIPDSAGYAGGPVRFVVQVEDTTGKITPLADTVVSGRNQGGVLHADLSPWASKRVTLRLIASPGTPSTTGQVFWGDPLVPSVLYTRILSETEPNDTVMTANVLSRGDTLRGGITPAGDRDYFVINAGEGDTLEVNAYTGVDSQPFWPGELTLMDSTGQVVARSLVPHRDYPLIPRARLRIAGGPAAKYFLRFSRGPDWDYPASDTGRYALAVRRLIPAAPLLVVEEPIAQFHDSVHIFVALQPNGRPTTMLVENTTVYPPTPMTSFGPFDSLDTVSLIASLPMAGPAYNQSVQFTANSDFGSAYPNQRYFSVPAPPSGWNPFWLRTMENVNSLSFAHGRFGAMATTQSLYCTSDSGLTWQKVSAPHVPGILAQVARPDSDLLIAVKAGSRIFRSTNGGTSWNEVGQSSFWISVMTFLDRNRGFAGNDYGELLSTTNGGATWNSRLLESSHPVRAILFIDTLRAFAATDSKIFQSTNSGQTWAPSPGLPAMSFDFRALIQCSGGALVAASSYLWARSSDGGQNWETGYLPLAVRSGASLNNGRAYLVGGEGKILFSGDGGVSWSDQSSGTSNDLLVAAKAGSRVVVGGRTGVLLRSVEGGAVAVEESPGVPNAFALHQNYPNPFNPMTRIRFDIPGASRVRLEVYNALGQLVATVLDDDRPAGRHEVPFSPSQLASGVYFYRLQATPLAGGEKAFIETKKMILLH